MFPTKFPSQRKGGRLRENLVSKLTFRGRRKGALVREKKDGTCKQREKKALSFL